MCAFSAYGNNIPGFILCVGPANERRHFYVTSSLIGPTHSQTGPYS